jgi:apolipoprotein N-acyltransferase
LSALALLALVLNGLYPHDPKPPSSWQGINTNFGAVAHGRVDPMIEYQTAEWIQQYALSASARVVVFPETVVPVWSTATEAFWHQTFDRLRATGKTILVGARVPLTTPRTSPVPYDFTANLAALHGATHAVRLPRLRSSPASESFPYINSVIIRGAQHAEFYQRIPVPIAMWNPLRSASARPHVLGPGVIEVADEKAAILVCYEQLLTWPVLRSATQQPTLLVGMANIHWATGTPIPAFQRTALRAWSRLFGIPAVTAINR